MQASNAAFRGRFCDFPGDLLQHLAVLRDKSAQIREKVALDARKEGKSGVLSLCFSGKIEKTSTKSQKSG
ncbi:hypothetical protein [uncultured Slackia sp.]|jgi:hypothetical protein|uniref:hypothetical protein n=1 Tax=uncultured Slackia sp. TaxID=665903 RepID=UPI0025CFF746|nr:hypothetical protein [uncultured Slackia sp.]